MKTHIIENGVVTNTILASVEEALAAFPNLVCIEGNEGAIGWLWDGSTLSAPPAPDKTPEEIQQEVTLAVQDRLDTFARTRNYDGILSACTYATSNVIKFQTEGQYCVNARDTTWAALYQILAEVQEGTRPMPSGYADIEPDLPALVWPDEAEEPEVPEEPN